MDSFQKLTTVFICVLSIHSVGCKPSVPKASPTDVGPTFNAPVGIGMTTINGVGYEYIATAERQAQILAGFLKLKVGQSREEVRAAIGLPDKAERRSAKESEEFQGWEYTYKLKMRASGPNRNDICVLVFFNPAHELVGAVPVNIAGLDEIHGPTAP